MSEGKVILAMGHTACGAIKGAIDGAKLGNLTGLLDKIKPAVEATQYDGERSSKNALFVDAVAATYVQHQCRDTQAQRCFERTGTRRQNQNRGFNVSSGRRPG